MVTLLYGSYREKMSEPTIRRSVSNNLGKIRKSVPERKGRKGERKVLRALARRAVTAAGASTEEISGAELLVIKLAHADHRAGEKFYCPGQKVTCIVVVAFVLHYSAASESCFGLK